MKTIVISALISFVLFWAWFIIIGMVVITFGHETADFVILSSIALTIGGLIGWLKTRLP